MRRPALALLLAIVATTAVLSATPAKAADNYACKGPVLLERGIAVTACLGSGDLSGNPEADDYGTKVDFSATTGRYRSCRVYMEYVEAGKTSTGSVGCVYQANTRGENRPAAHSFCVVGDQLRWTVYVEYRLMPTPKVTHRTQKTSVTVYCRDI
jgi:hypothetical protein